MEKKKKLEQIILVVLIPVFVLSLLYTRIKKKTPSEKLGLGADLEKVYLEDETIDAIPKPDAVLNVRFEGDAKDPLKNTLQVHLHKMRLKEEARRSKRPEKKTKPLPRLDIGGLVWDTDMPQAIINGKVVRIGDAIEGVKIVNIEKEGITVMHLEETIFIPK